MSTHIINKVWFLEGSTIRDGWDHRNFDVFVNANGDMYKTDKYGIKYDKVYRVRVHVGEPFRFIVIYEKVD